MTFSDLLRARPRSVDTTIAIEQAMNVIVRASRDTFKITQKILENALTSRPDDPDLQVALASHLLRGIQSVWYDPSDNTAVEQRAQDLLRKALASDPDYIPTLQASCRFSTTTNAFDEGLITCAKALSFEPWDRLSLFQMGMSQIQLGLFDEGLASFTRADRFDTPQVSRWTWLLGIGLTDVLMGHDADAIVWLRRSLAVTPGTGRTHFTLATSLQRLGRTDEARQAVTAGLALRPGATAENVRLPMRHASQAFIARTEEMKSLLIQAGFLGNKSVLGFGTRSDGRVCACISGACNLLRATAP